MSDQTATYTLPNDVLEKLHCSHCNAYVSCGPVKAQSNGAIICGRCSPSSDENFSPQVVFEIVMAKFTFPCRYTSQGCEKRVLFNHAIEHECNCLYRTVSCPALPHESCKKDVSAFDVYSHFDEMHSDLILKDEKFKLEFVQDIQYNLLMAKNDIIVVIQCIYNSVTKILNIDVRHFSQDNKKVIYYKLQIISGCDSGNSINLKERQCNRYESHTVNLHSTITLEIENYLPVLENPSFVYIHVELLVKALQNEIKNDSSSTAVTLEIESDDKHEEIALSAWNKLEKFRCNFCYSFAIPPVYISSRSHSCICSECKDQGRCTAIDAGVDLPDYPCRWWGCTFIGNYEKIKDHIENCQFRTFVCPVSFLCDEGYYTLNNVMEHMQSHGTYCSNPEKIVIKLFNTNFDSEKKIYFTFFENRVIAFTCSISMKYEWNLSGDTEKMNTDVYFQHDHCRFKSKTTTYTNRIDISYKNSVSFPACFKHCRRISAVLKLAKQIK